MRKEKDVHKLLVSKFEVKLPKENDTSELRVIFEGPQDSPYKDVSQILNQSFHITITCRDNGK